MHFGFLAPFLSAEASSVVASPVCRERLLLWKWALVLFGRASLPPQTLRSSLPQAGVHFSAADTPPL